MANYVYTMNRVGKIVPPKRQILKDISLSFFPGAKIGVLGLNGSGKSTLLKIMAGIDKDIEGEAVPHAQPEHRLPAAGAAARPGADRARGGRGRPGRSLRRPAPSSTRSMPPMPNRTPTSTRWPPSRRGWKPSFPPATAATWSCSWKWPPTRCACRRGTRRSACCPAARSAAWRCAGCCCPSPTCCCWTSRPTTWTPNRSTGSSSSCTRFPGTVVGITHDRYFLDNAAEWILELDRGHGIPWKGNYSSWLEQKENRLKQEEVDRERAPEGAAQGTGMGAPEPEGPAGQEQGAPGPLQRTVRARIPEAQRDPGNLHSRGRAAGQ